MTNRESIRRTLSRIDGLGYKAYKDLRGTYSFPELILYIDHVQGDPFAAPSRLRIRIAQERAQYPDHLFANPSRRRALCTYMAGRFACAADRAAIRSGSGKSGLIQIDSPGQEILERSCIQVTDAYVEARFFVGLPAAGRRVLGELATKLLCEAIPTIAESALIYRNSDAAAIDRFVCTCEDADALRSSIATRGLVAFVADGALLPRATGVDDRPLSGDGVVRFESPPSLRVEIELPNAGVVSGMGIPAGVTLVVGGGFHGKSTLLKALELGVYDHIPDDGREFVVTDPTAVAIRAEDGRHVAGVDLTPFIRHLPFRRDTRFFSTDNASGSTSQAANIVEALESGAHLLLIDEDTAATNFMIRDGRMQQLISSDREPITPFVDRVRQLHEEHGVSTILVMGGSGDYFAVADTVIAMENYAPRDVSVEAAAIAAGCGNDRRRESRGPFGRLTGRIPDRASIDPRRGRRARSVQIRGASIGLGAETIDLSAVEQLVHSSQTRALAAAILYAVDHYMNDRRPLSELLDCVMADLQAGGLDILCEHPPCDYALFRRFELAAALNRLRTFRVEQVPGSQTAP